MVSKIFYFHPYLGKIPILTNIFQRGWNHQLAIHSIDFFQGVSTSSNHHTRCHKFLWVNVLWSFVRKPQKTSTWFGSGRYWIGKSSGRRDFKHVETFSSLMPKSPVWMKPRQPNRFQFPMEPWDVGWSWMVGHKQMRDFRCTRCSTGICFFVFITGMSMVLSNWIVTPI